MNLTYALGGYVPTEPAKGVALAFPLTIPAHDGSSTTTHPSVVYDPDGWNGFKYWMAHTPYPDGAREKPNIVCSNDGWSWQVPPGLTNPIAEPGGGGEVLSDTELVWMPNGDLACYYRGYIGSTVDTLYRRTSSDGATWSAADTCIHETNGQILLSPSIVLEGDTYTMWTVADIDKSQRGLHRRTSTDGVTWSAPTACSFPAVNVWHMDVEKVGSTYHMLMNYAISQASHRLAHWTSDDGLAWSGDVVADVPLQPGYTRHYRSALLARPAGRFDVWTCEIPASGDWRLAFHHDLALGNTYDPTFPIAESASYDGAWTLTGGGFTTAGGRATATATPSRAVKDWGVPNGVVESVVPDAMASMVEWWVIARWTNSSNYLRVGTDGAGGRFRLQEIKSGVVTTLIAHNDLFIRPGDTVGLLLGGDAIEARLNGVKVGSATSTVNVGVGVHGIHTALGGSFDAVTVRTRRALPS